MLDFVPMNVPTHIQQLAAAAPAPTEDELSMILLNAIPPGLELTRTSLYMVNKLTLTRKNLNHITIRPELAHHLQRLYLDQNFLIALPREIGLLTTLVALDLSHNSIRELPDSISALIRIVDFRIQSNGLLSIPDSIVKCTRLSRLDLHYNSIKRLPENIGTLTNLEELRLYQNRLIEIPESISLLTKLN